MHFGAKIAAKIKIFDKKIPEMHDREANRTYRDRTSESKYLSAVDPSERGECLLIRHLNRSGVMPFWLGGLRTSAFVILAGKIGVSKIGKRRHMQGRHLELTEKKANEGQRHLRS